MKHKWPLRTIVEVTWRDSHAKHGWGPMSDITSDRDVGPCRTAGYLVTTTKRMVTIAQSMSLPTGHAADTITIPREAVTSIRVLKGKRPEAK